MKLLIHFLLFIILTIITQIGGIVYAITLFTFKNTIKRIIGFCLLYLILTFLIVPNIAPFFDREKIKNTQNIQAHFFLTVLANRNYVKPQLNKTLQKIATELSKKHPTIKLVYLDANFPFINKFPLLPHISHNDGKKIDIAFIYTDGNKLTNKKPSTSGYGFFENPKNNEFNQTEYCKNRNYWQYDYPKFLTFGSFNKNLQFPKNVNRFLLQLIYRQKEVEKIFIEPHLKKRLNLTNSKIRFHGCRAVRHDDHIHFQLK